MSSRAEGEDRRRLPRAAAADGSIGERLEATGQIINIGGPKEFADSIDEQSANVAAVVKAIDFKPKN